MTAQHRNEAAGIEAPPIRSFRAGGEVVQPIDPHASEVTATFRDPAGNVIGLYQQPGLAETEGLS